LDIFLKSGIQDDNLSIVFSFSSPNNRIIENEDAIKNDAAPAVAKEAWIKSQTLDNASDNGVASGDKEDDQPIIRNEINETGRSKMDERILNN
jgi:hypothetical protein